MSHYVITSNAIDRTVRGTTLSAAAKDAERLFGKSEVTGIRVATEREAARFEREQHERLIAAYGKPFSDSKTFDL